MKRIGLVPKPGLTGSERPGSHRLIDLAHRLVDRLTERGVTAAAPAELKTALVEAGLNRVADLPPEEYGDLDLIIVLGGDGTMLHAARLVGPKDVPLLGANLGGLGFLTAVTADELIDTVEMVLDGKIEPETRMRLQLKVHRTNGEIFESLILNDAVLTKGALARIVNLTARIDGRRLTDYRADGLIVATPTGSTAYNLSAGGPILNPTLEAMILTPICPFTLANRPLVVGHQSVITITTDQAAEDLFLTCDGQKGLPLGRGDEIEISRGRGIRLIPSPFHDHYAILRTKLGWGVGGSVNGQNGSD